MNVIGITAQEQDSILRMLSAIMWIGNIPFTESKDKVTVSSKESKNISKNFRSTSNFF